MKTHVGAISVVDERVDQFLREAFESLKEHRGGKRLYRDIRDESGAETDDQLNRILVETGSLTGAFHDDVLCAVAMTSPRSRDLVMGIYVSPTKRRHHLAQQLLNVLFEGETPPRDAWVLPGDRATKSLYEKTKWKARRLTMSGD